MFVCLFVCLFIYLFVCLYRYSTLCSLCAVPDHCRPDTDDFTGKTSSFLQSLCYCWSYTLRTDHQTTTRAFFCVCPYVKILSETPPTSFFMNKNNNFTKRKENGIELSRLHSNAFNIADIFAIQRSMAKCQRFGSRMPYSDKNGYTLTSIKKKSSSAVAYNLVGLSTPCTAAAYLQVPILSTIFIVKMYTKE